jgi:hypothetical protein
MINQQEQLKNLAKSDNGKVLIDWLEDQIKQMTDITAIKTYEELLGKQESVKVLKELFSFLVKAREVPKEVIKTSYL